ncbi:hypothetical protein [Streptomyces sp. NBC_00887]|nr:hypothetical protein OG844_12550 [Streptomyces sp. NBC_00887]
MSSYFCADRLLRADTVNNLGSTAGRSDPRDWLSPVTVLLVPR